MRRYIRHVTGYDVSPGMRAIVVDFKVLHTYHAGEE